MLNQNLDLDITDFVTVNMNALVEVVDALGGFDFELTDEEVVHMNNYVWRLRRSPENPMKELSRRLPALIT